ncbi:hypothetical protein M7I_6674 [Glarea lozoyensis 74030]|uniref:Heterokaryon incompatibility domain-containing protein n=1 Tax=Glarea lozoyensis (strain ATCC 74030 / MF5533) TaxID=1104152 RepID=H0EV79_GLAL7|nr:hypothetical protein M7I_6674 [Glarea lozoyensis 74030]
MGHSRLPSASARHPSTTNFKIPYSATNELRLLRLLSLASSNRTAASAASDDTQDYHDTEIVCELFHAFADDKPKYHALSYTWGSAEGTELISLDGIQVPVTENLADALKNIRDDHNNIVLWLVQHDSLPRSLRR